MLDPQVAAFLDRLRALNAPPVWEVSPEIQRAGYDAAAPELFGEPEPVRSVQDTDAGGVPVRIYGPAETASPAIVFFHGGGWVNGSIISHDGFCQTLSARSGCTVVNVGYRLAPEHKFPAAIEDAWTATHWAAANFPHVAVCGDSAGGQLAASVALRARESSLNLRAQVLIYPVTDDSMQYDSYRAETDPVALTEESMRWYWSQYLPASHRGVRSDYAPASASDLDGLAPALIITAEHDPLRDEAELYAARLKAAGVPVVLHRYEGMVHGFIRWRAHVDAADRALTEVAQTLAKALR